MNDRRYGWMRSLLYPCLPPLGLWLVLAVLWLCLDLACRTSLGASVYNDWLLWLALRTGLFAGVATCLLSIALIVVATVDRHNGSFRRRGWTTWIVRFVWASLTLLAGSYCLWPLGLSRYAPWLALPFALALLWLWLHATWVYFPPLFTFVRRSVRSYWSTLSGPSAYVEVMRRIRRVQRRRHDDHVASTTAKPYPTPTLAPFATSWWERLFQRTARLLGAETVEPRRPRWPARCLAACTSRVPASLAAADEILVNELRYLVDHQWYEIERQLFADTAEERPEDEMAGHDRRRPQRADLLATARRMFQRWERLAEALVECHVFEALSEAPSSLDPLLSPMARDRTSVAGSVAEGAELLATVSRRWCLPILRADPRAIDADPNSVSFCWWAASPHETQASDNSSSVSQERRELEEAEAALQRAAECVDRECQALAWLVGGSSAQQDVESLMRQYRQVRRARDFQPGKSVRGLLILRLLLAKIVGHSLRPSANHDRRQLTHHLPPDLWPELGEIMEWDIRPLLFGQAGVSSLTRSLAWAVRQRYFDACLMSTKPQRRNLRHEIDACRDRWQENDERRVGGNKSSRKRRPAIRTQLDQLPDERVDEWYAGHANLHDAWDASRPFDERVDAARRAIAAFEASGAYAARKVIETLGADLREEVALRMTIAQPQDAPPEPTYRSSQLHGSWHAPFRRSRPPNVFTQAHLGAVWLVAGLAAALALIVMAPRPVIPAPDLRLGGRHLQESVRFIAPGREADEQSVWVATQSGGVHVKGPGDDHYWFQLTQENTRRGERPGLLSDDVHRIDMVQSTPIVSYFGERNGRKTVVVSDYPAEPPGARPWSRPRTWSTFIGDSRFATTSGREISTVLQPTNCPLLLLGTSDGKLGRYHVEDRRWLDRAGPLDGPARDLTIASSNGFLAPTQQAIHSIAAIEHGEEWIAWVATNDGLAGGPVWSPRNDGPLGAGLKPSDWRHIVGERLIDGNVRKVALRSTAQGLAFDYCTADGGFGSVGAPQSDQPEFLVRVGQHRVDQLDEANIRRAVYGNAPDDRRIWVVDNRPDDTHRVSVYRERSHEWNTATAPAGRQVLDLQVDPRTSSTVVLGTNRGVQSLVDNATVDLQLREHGLTDATVQQVLVTEQQVFARAQRGGEAFPGVYALSRAAQGRLPDAAHADWQTLIGTRRFDQKSLALADVTIIEPAANGRDLYFGTRSWGAGRIDRGTREVYRVGPMTPTLHRGVLDLCVIPDLSGTHDRYLLQVTDENIIQCIDLQDGSTHPVWNHTSSGVSDPLVDVAVYDQALYIGARDHVARYRLDDHIWTPIEHLVGLKRLIVANHSSANTATDHQRLWAYTDEQGGALRVMSEDRHRPTWSEPLITDVVSVDPGPNDLAVATRSGALAVVRPDGGHTFQLIPTRLHDVNELPDPGYSRVTHAAVGRPGDDDAVYVAFGSRLARFDLARHEWTKLERPAGKPLERMFANQSGLWLLDDQQRLSLRQGSEESERVQRVRDVAWGATEALTLSADGNVARLTRDLQETLVGDRFGESDELVTRTRVVCRFGTDLFVATDVRLGQYSFRTHDWRDITPDGATTIAQLVATTSHLYARDVNGRLWWWRPEPRKWQLLNDELEDAIRETGAHFIRAAEVRVNAVAAITGGLAVVVENRGALFLEDAAPSQPRWLVARSQGPPQDAVITSAAELGEDLALGTQTDGLWIYSRVSNVAPGTGNPVHAWQHISLGTVLQIEPIPHDADRVAIRTSNALWLIQRESTRTWREKRQVASASPRDIAATRDGLYWITSDAEDGPTSLFWLPAPFEDEPTALVSAPTMGSATTRSVVVVPPTGDVLRADDQGHVARYDVTAHRWANEEVGTNPAGGFELFIVGEIAWAWSPAERALYRRHPDRTWKPFSVAGELSAWEHVVHDEHGVVALSADGQLVHIDESGEWNELLPKTPNVDAQDWREGLLAELGHWLIVATPQRTWAYHRRRHAWMKLFDEPVRSCDAETLSDGTRRVYFHVKERLWSVTARDDELLTTEVAVAFLPRQQSPTAIVVASAGEVPWPLLLAVAAGVCGFVLLFVSWKRHSLRGRRATVGLGATLFIASAGCGIWLATSYWFPSPTLVTDGSRILSFAADGTIREVRDGIASDAPLVQPIPLNESSPPRIAAAVEYEGCLLLAHSGSESGRLAVYDPERAHWHAITVNGGAVERFWRTSKHLFAEVVAPTTTGSDDESSTRELVRIVCNGPGLWGIESVASPIHDVASDGETIWFIDADRRIQSCDSEGRIERTQPPHSPALPAAIRALVPNRRALVALLADGSLWDYGLDNWSWRRSHDQAGFLEVFVSRGNVFAVQVSEDRLARTIWQFVDEPSGRGRWVALQADHSGAVAIPETVRDTKADPWQVQATAERRTVLWRSQEQGKFGEAHLTDSTADCGRMDFDRYDQIEWHDGTLRCVTQARIDSDIVIRRFRVVSGHMTDEIRDDRTPSAGERASAATASSGRTARPPWQVSGERFEVREVADSHWLAEDGTQLTITLEHVGGNPVDVNMIDIEGRWGLDIDHWTHVVPDEDLLHLTSELGVVTLQIEGDGRFQRIAFLPSREAARVVRSEHEILARVNDGEYYRFSPNRSWVKIPDQMAAKRTFDRAASVLRSNRHLSSWRIEEEGGYRLQMRLPEARDGGPPEFADVTLDDQGFAFDRGIACSLDQNFVWMYGPDGRVQLSRKNGPNAPLHLDVRLRFAPDQIPSDTYRVVQEENRDAPMLLGATHAYEFRDDGWNTVDAARASDVRARLRQSLFRGHGWTWTANDEVTMAGTPFSAAHPFQARFDARLGQFSFDRLRALHGGGEHLWAASDGGVMTWDGSQTIGGDAAPQSTAGDASGARFFHVDDRPYLHLPARDSGADGRLFTRSSEWKPVNDVAHVHAIMNDDARRLLDGKNWRLTRTGANAGEKLTLGRLNVSRVIGGDALPHTWLAERCWDRETVTCVADDGKRTICGTTKGLLDLSIGRFFPVDSGLDRLAWERDRWHGGSKRNEFWFTYDDQPRRIGEGVLFVERDRLLYEDERWRWERSNAGTVSIQARLGPTVPWRPVGVAGGRFDFDRVTGLAVDGDRALLATATGLLLRRSSNDGTYDVVEPLDGPSLRDPCLFTLWWNGARRLFVSSSRQGEFPAGSVFLRNATWSELDDSSAATVLALARTQESQNNRWIITRATPAFTVDGGPKFQLVLPARAPQPVAFAAEDGTFSLSVVTSIAWTSDSLRLDVATAGGLLRYGPDGRLEDLRSDFQSPVVPVAALNLWRTSSGTLAELDGNNGFRQRSEADWAPHDETLARQQILELRRWVAATSNGWTIERVRASDRDEFHFQFAQQPLTLASSFGSLAFLHDQAVSAEWDRGAVWVASHAGVLKLTWQGDRLVVPSDGQHLWTRAFVGCRPNLLRKNSSRQNEEDDRWVCRTTRDGREERLSQNPRDPSIWHPEPILDRSVVLHADDGFWEWRTPSPGRVQIVPNRTAFQPSVPESLEWFCDGQLTFWNTGNTPLMDKDRLGFREGLFVSTTGGIVRLSLAADSPDRVYSLSAAWPTSEPPVEFGADERGHLMAKSNRGLWQFTPKDDAWSPTSATFLGRDRPVQCGWLVFAQDSQQKMTARLSPGVPGAASLATDKTILSNGRFTFDDVHDFVAAHDRFWLLTSLGVVELNALDGSLRSASATPHDRTDALQSLHVKDGEVYVCDQSRTAWRRQSDHSWTSNVPDNCDWNSLRTVANNMLMAIRASGPAKFEYSFQTFSQTQGNTDSTPLHDNLLWNGVFAFDDLRDVRVRNDRLLVASRAGVWEYEPARIATLLNGTSHVSLPDPTARCPVAAHATNGQEHFAPSSEITVRVFTDDPSTTDWHVTIEDTPVRTLSVARVTEGAQDTVVRYEFPDDIAAPQNLASAFATRSSIWIPLPNGLLWVRKSVVPVRQQPARR